MRLRILLLSWACTILAWPVAAAAGAALSGSSPPPTVTSGPTSPAGTEQTREVPSRPEMLPLEEEIELALSAAPEHLRKRAAVWALTETGFVEARAGDNGFACVVNRDHPLNRKPTCYDAEGVRTILPKVRLVGDLLRQGVDLAEIDRRVRARFESGEFVSPQRPGVAYMLSTQIRNYNAQTGSVDGFPPHVMFYAPGVANSDIGTSWEALRDKPWLPFVAYEGPHGFFVMVVGDRDE